MTDQFLTKITIDHVLSIFRHCREVTNVTPVEMLILMTVFAAYAGEGEIRPGEIGANGIPLQRLATHLGMDRTTLRRRVIRLNALSLLSFSEGGGGVAPGPGAPLHRLECSTVARMTLAHVQRVQAVEAERPR